MAMIIYLNEHSPGLRGVANSNLPDRTVLAKNVVHLFRRDLVRNVSNVQNSVHFGR